MTTIRLEDQFGRPGHALTNSVPAAILISAITGSVCPPRVVDLFARPLTPAGRRRQRTSRRSHAGRIPRPRSDPGEADAGVTERNASHDALQASSSPTVRSSPCAELAGANLDGKGDLRHLRPECVQVIDDVLPWHFREVARAHRDLRPSQPEVAKMGAAGRESGLAFVLAPDRRWLATEQSPDGSRRDFRAVGPAPQMTQSTQASGRFIEIIRPAERHFSGWTQIRVRFSTHCSTRRGPPSAELGPRHERAARAETASHIGCST